MNLQWSGVMGLGFQMRTDTVCAPTVCQALAGRLTSHPPSVRHKTEPRRLPSTAWSESGPKVRFPRGPGAIRGYIPMPASISQAVLHHSSSPAVRFAQVSRGLPAILGFACRQPSCPSHHPSRPQQGKRDIGESPWLLPALAHE